MGDDLRYRRGETSPVVSPALLATGIAIGDICQLDTDDVKTAADETWDTDLATTQENFHDHFLGIAGQRSRATLDEDDVRVSTEGVFEFTCAAATFEVGDLVGPEDDGASGLENQKVVAVATANLAIGRVAKRYGSNTTTVEVRVFSTVMLGGVQAMA